MEEWRAVVGYEGLYEVSDQGRVRSLDRVVVTSHGVMRRIPGREMKPSRDSAGRRRVVLTAPTGKRTKLLSREVLLAFEGDPPEGKPFSLHGNGDPSDNRLCNLRWGSPQDNADDKARHGTHHNTVKTHCKAGHRFPNPGSPRTASPRVCQPCKEERRRTPLPLGAKQHGTASGYVRHNCRCEKCKKWRSDEWYRRKALELAKSTRLEV